MFITQGVHILHNRDYSLTIQHPPLAKILIALPTIGMELDIQSPEDIVDKNYMPDKANPLLKEYVGKYKPDQLDQLARNPYYIAYHFLYSHNGRDVADIFKRCRRVVQLMHYLLVLAIYFLVRKLFGSNAAIVAACIAFFDPNMTAHGHLTTTDMPVALFSVLSFTALVYLIDKDKPDPVSLLLWGISLGLMCAAKFSCFILLPIHAGIYLWAFRQRIKPAIIGLAGAAVMLIIVCFIIGGFSFSPYTNALHQLAANLQKGRPSYLLGHYSNSGFPAYYLVALLFKMPLGLLLMMFGGIAAAFIRRKTNRVSLGEIALWLMAGLYLLSTIFFHSSNLGIRHTLIIYPFLIAIAASVFPRIPKLKGLTGLGILMTALILVESIPAMGNPIPFFNIPSRKAALEGKLLADSNIDWGQDLSRLKSFCTRNNIKHLHLRYFGTADANFHLGDIRGFTLDIMGPEYNDGPVTPGWYAVSLQKLLVVRGRAKHEAGQKTALWWLREMEPIETVGGSIFIFRVGDE